MLAAQQAGIKTGVYIYSYAKMCRRQRWRRSLY